ncbi:MAG TPA: class I SAM-dependent methyltransferase [Saprospiraceae bacterium]|nr:class I SAM-dependent methyltransferase [Saprospiraceae bacterium]HMU02448.1 class I SAM-dependent methyltransferase [Saprospiraceae bacterium]
MFDFHTDKPRYFEIQRVVTEESIIPFITPFLHKSTHNRILEVGCAEAGVLKAFLNYGYNVTGVELSTARYENAKKFLAEDIQQGRAAVINQNIYDIDPKEAFPQLFDVIVLKDVIEHIPDQERFIPKLKEFLTDDGIIFFAYPPWWMPFGGHQQICDHKLLRTLPWFHLLPISVYTWILKSFRENKGTIKELLEIKDTGINIGRMYRILEANQFKILDEVHWFINPIYKHKFGWNQKKLLPFLARIPLLRNFITTAHYIVFKK